MNNVGINVTINAANAQAGAQQTAQAIALIQSALSTVSTPLNAMNANMVQLIQTMQQVRNANQNTASSFGAFTAATLAAGYIRELMDSIKDLFVESTLYAARTQELGVALNAVAKAGNINVEILKQQEYAMRQLNITTQDARQTLARFVQANLDLNQAGALARTAQDLAVIAGVSTSEEINKLIIGIQTLQSRNLRTAGVFITVDETLDRLAKTSHRARDSFSTLEKQQATLNAVLEFGARVTGAYEAAMTTASKQIRSLDRLVAEAQNAFGSQFLPVLEVVVKAISEMFVQMERHPRIFTLLTVSVGLLTASFVLLNTNLLRTIINFGAFALQGVARMLSTLPGMNVNLAATALNLGIVGDAAVVATAEITGLQLALGGFSAILGIVGLVVGLTAAFSTAGDASSRFQKIADSEITQIGRNIKAYQEQIEVLKAYNEAQANISSNPALGETVKTFKELTAETVNNKSIEETVVKAQDALSGLKGEAKGLKEQFDALKNTDMFSVSNAEQASKIKNRLDDISTAVDFQNKAHAAGQLQLDKSTESQRKLSDTLKASLNVLGMSADKIYDIVQLDKEQIKINKDLNSEQQVRLKNHKNLIEVNQELINTERQLAGAYAYGLNQNLANTAKEIEAVKQRIAAIKEEQAFKLKQAEIIISPPGAPDAIPLYRPASERTAEAVARRAAEKQERNDTFNRENRAQRIADATRVSNEALADEADKYLTLLGKEREQIRQQDFLITQTGLSTLALAQNVYQTDQSTEAVLKLAAQFDDTRDRAKKFRDQIEDAKFTLVGMEEALGNIHLSPLDPSGAEKAGRLLTDFPKLIKEFGLVSGKPLSPEGILGDPKLLDELVQRSGKSIKELRAVTDDSFGGDALKFVSEGMKKVALDDEDIYSKLLLAMLKRSEEIKKTAQDSHKTVRDEAARISESLKKTKEDIASFLNPNAKEFKLRIELEDAERTKKDLETIMTLRHKMGIPLNLPINLANVQKTRKELEVLANVFDEVAKANNQAAEARIRAGAPVVNAQVRAETQLLNLVRERRDEEQQISSEITAAIIKRTQLETESGNVQRIQAKAFLDAMNENQAGLDSALASVTKSAIRNGDFSFADNNKIIQDALKNANDPVVSALGDTQKVISDSTALINQSQVDFSKALGDTVLRTGDAVRGGLNETVIELRNHASIQSNMLTTLQSIESKTGGGFGAEGSAGGGIIGGRGALSQGEVAGALQAAGWPSRLIPIMTAIAFKESSGIPSNSKIDNVEHSIGLFQINQNAHRDLGFSDQQLTNPVTNARAALAVFRKQGLHAWTTFTSSLFKRFYTDTQDVFGYATTKMAQQKKEVKLPLATLIKNMIDKAQGKGQPIAVSENKQLTEYLAVFGQAQKNLGFNYTTENYSKFNSQQGVQALADVDKQLSDEKEANKVRELSLDLRRQSSVAIDKEHLNTLRLNEQEEQYTRGQKVRIDNGFEIEKQTRELNRLREDGVSILEVLQQAELDRGHAAIEASTQSLKLSEEENFRLTRNAEYRRRLFEDENNRRWKSDQDLKDRLELLRRDEDSGYFQSERFRSRIALEGDASRLESRKNLNIDIARLDDELLHLGENNALEYGKVWREVTRDIANKDFEAIKNSIRSTAEIADQGTISVARIRSKVLGDISQIEDASTSIGNLFSQTFKVYTDDIDRWIDKTTESMGNLGKIFNGFFKSIAHRAVGSIEKSILDTLFPATAEETAAKSGVGVGGADTESAFRQAADAARLLGEAQRVSIQPTIDSANAEQTVAAAAVNLSSAFTMLGQACDVAVQGLIRVGTGGGGGLNVGGLGGGAGLANLLPILTGGLGGGGITGTSSGNASGARGIGLGLNRLFQGGGIGNLGSNANPFSGILSGLTPGFNGGSLLSRTGIQTLPTLSGGGAKGGFLQQLLSTFGLGGIGGKGGLLSSAGIKGLVGSLATQAPLLGLGLGASLGGQSRPGSILGALGGGLAGLGILGGLSAATLGGIGGGLGASVATGLGGIFGTTSGLGGAFAGLFGGTGSLASFAAIAGPVALIAAPLIAAAIIFSKNKARQMAEKTRQQMSVDINARLTEILTNVKNDKMDGAQALSAADQAFADYRTQMATIKDGKTRRNAEIYITSREHPPMLLLDQIKTAVAQQKARREIDTKIIPTYSQGGTAYTNLVRVSGQETMFFPDGSMARVPGTYDGRDNVMAFVPKGTEIRNPRQVNSARAYGGGGIEGVAPAARAASSSRAAVTHVTVINVMSDEEAQRLANKIPDAVIGQKAANDSMLNPSRLPAAIMASQEY